MARTLTSISSATDGTAVTPSDTASIPETRGLTSVAGGTATVRFVDSTADVQVQLNAGVVYTYNVIAVRLTGTSATGIVALR